MRWAVVPVGIGLLCGCGLARDFFVSPTGRDGADGLTPETAMKTFAATAPQLHDGDVLRLQRNGVWHETLRLPSGAPGRPIHVTAYGDGALPTIDGSGLQPLEMCVDASASNLVIDSLRITGAFAKDRGALTIWANGNYSNITIEHCQIEKNSGRGIWIAGEMGKAVTGVYIHGNTFTDNNGCGVLATKLSHSWVMDNDFVGNCSRYVDEWQAAVRVWSEDVSDLWISGNRIDNGLHHLEQGAGMGVHVDETGPGVFVTANKIRHCDAAGIEIENTRGVTVQGNVIVDAHTGIFVYRAGHNHLIDHNTVSARSQGIVLQGWLAHGVDAGPEITIGGQLLTGNVISHNIAIAQQYGSLKLVGGGERLTGANANTVSNNAFGANRPGLIELGNQIFGNYDGLESRGIRNSVAGNPLISDGDHGDPQLQADGGDLGAQHFQVNR